jgi:hypothetical protein
LENFTVSEFHRILDGSFIYRRDLGYDFRIIFKSVEENYSREKRFSDKFWKCFTTDVLSVDFLFLQVMFVAAREN